MRSESTCRSFAASQLAAPAATPRPEVSASRDRVHSFGEQKKGLFSPKGLITWLVHGIPAMPLSAGSWELDLGEGRAPPRHRVVPHTKTRTPRGDVLKVLLVCCHRVATPRLRPCPLQRIPLARHLLLSLRERQAAGHTRASLSLTCSPGTSQSFASFGFSLEQPVYPQGSSQT